MRKLITLAALASLLITAAVALAATRSEHKFSLTFTAKTPSTATGMDFFTNRYAYKPPAPGQRADPVKKIVFTLAKGSKLNLGAAPSCTQKKLEDTGPTACPSGSKVGSGSAIVITGLSAVDPVREKVQVFVGKNQLLSYLTGVQTTVIPLSISGSTMTAVVPRVCLPGGTPADNCKNGEAVLTRLTVAIKRTTSGSKSLVTTPSSCPSTKKWTNQAKYSWANGDTEVRKATSLCRK